MQVSLWRVGALLALVAGALVLVRPALPQGGLRRDAVNQPGGPAVAEAERMGIPLTRVDTDDEMVDGFELAVANYQALSGFTQKGVDGVGLTLGWVERTIDLVHSDGAELTVTLAVAQDYSRDARLGLAAGFAIPATNALWPPASALHADNPPVGEYAVVIRDARGEPGAEVEFETAVYFYRRNVMVVLSLFWGPVPELSLLQLAKAIDSDIQRRPLIRSLDASQRRPQITELTARFEPAVRAAPAKFHGTIVAADPADLPLTEFAWGEGADAQMLGPSKGVFEYIPFASTREPLTILAGVANTLNLATFRTLKVSPR